MNNVAAAVKLNAHWKGFFLTRSPHAQPMAIHDAGIRRTVTFHCLAAFIFNIGVLAFTINVLGG